jgi:acylglycerol lipase
MTSAAPSICERFQFGPRARPFELDEHVRGYAWRRATPWAVVVLVHGLQSHAQWFAEASELLLDRGLGVYAVDRRGSGSSTGVRGDIHHYSDWLGDVERVVHLAQTENPGVPLHLVGHCFGANLGLGVILRRRVKPASLVMLTPGFFVRPDYSAVEKTRILVTGLVLPGARYRVPQDDGLFSRDPEVVSWISADRLGAKSLTARCLLQINFMIRELRRDVSELSVPLLVLEAAHDRLSDNQRNRKLLNKALGARYHWQTFDAEHFLLAEPCRDRVIDALVDWVRDN